MEDEVSLLPDPTEARDKSPSSNREVYFDVATESVILKATTEDNTATMGMKSSYPGTEASDTDGTVDENHEYSTVLLKKKKQSFWPSYHTHDPERTITPFAIILLVVLFAIYILNQADRLVLPVAIPSGLRCVVTEKNECRNLTDMKSEGYTMTSDVDLSESINVSNKTQDCIDFNDYEQGLLTGILYIMIIWFAGVLISPFPNRSSFYSDLCSGRPSFGSSG